MEPSELMDKKDASTGVVFVQNISPGQTSYNDFLHLINHLNSGIMIIIAVKKEMIFTVVSIRAVYA